MRFEWHVQLASPTFQSTIHELRIIMDSLNRLHGWYLGDNGDSSQKAELQRSSPPQNSTTLERIIPLAIRDRLPSVPIRFVPADIKDRLVKLPETMPKFSEVRNTLVKNLHKGTDTFSQNDGYVANSSQKLHWTSLGKSYPKER